MPPSEQPQTNGQTAVSAIQDAVYGTRNYTPGAKYQLPRKVPLRIEPKTYFGEQTHHLRGHSVNLSVPDELLSRNSTNYA